MQAAVSKTDAHAAATTKWLRFSVKEPHGERPRIARTPAGSRPAGVLAGKRATPVLSTLPATAVKTVGALKPPERGLKKSLAGAAGRSSARRAVGHSCPAWLAQAAQRPASRLHTRPSGAQHSPVRPCAGWRAAGTMALRVHG